jgi:glycosyltransferase involved in cell wall biosynthesis
MEREALLSNDKSLQKAALDMKLIEYQAINSADSVIVHSTVERDLLRPDFPSSFLNVFPLIIDIKKPKAKFTDRKNIVFIGGYQHTPNIDAVKFFVAEVMPLIREKIPGVCFYAVGSNPPEEIQRLSCADVVITGYVEDLVSLMETMKVSVAPLRYGAGIKGKIGTAMASGVPVVATNLAIEGMSMEAGQSILVADTPSDIAANIAKLYVDERLWERIASNGLKFAKTNWGDESAYQILRNILGEVGLVVSANPSRPLTLYRK